MKCVRKKVFLCLIPFLVFTTADMVHAVTLGFEAITNNGAASVTIGEAQFFVDVDPFGVGQVKFTFSNIGPENSAIAEIYFDDGTLLGIAAIDESLAGVDFEDIGMPVMPGNLPGGELISPPFEATAGFVTEPTNPEPTMGVNPGEWVAIIFDLLPGLTYNDVLNSLDDGSLRIGIHAKSFDNGQSESYIQTPEPGTMALLGLGLLGLRRRRR